MPIKADTPPDTPSHPLTNGGYPMSPLTWAGAAAVLAVTSFLCGRYVSNGLSNMFDIVAIVLAITAVLFFFRWANKAAKSGGKFARLVELLRQALAYE